MKPFIYFLLWFFLPFGIKAQETGPTESKIKSAKRAYINEALGLNSDQNSKFWPLYDASESERRSVRKQFFDKYKTERGATKYDDKAMQFIDDNLEYQQQELSIRKRYKDQFLKVISPSQLAALYDAERNFKRKLIQMLRE